MMPARISARGSQGPSRGRRGQDGSRGPRQGDSRPDGTRPARPPRGRQDGDTGPRPSRSPHDRQDGKAGQRQNRSGSPQPGSRPTRPAHPVFRGGDGPTGSRRSRRPATPPFTIKGELLFGRNAILESLRSGQRPATRLWVAEGMRQDPRVDEIIALARDLDVLVEMVPRSMLDDQEPDVNHQGVLLETAEYPYVDLADVVDANGNVLILDHLQDPQNFGTLLRAADAAGVAGVIIPSDRSASVNPTVVNASSGAVEHLRIAQVPNLGNAIDKLEASGRWIIGLDSGPNAKDLFTTDVPIPAALVVGSEGPGLSAGIRKRCQLVVSLPMLGKVDSLNASTAGSIALFDLLRRIRAQAPTPVVD